MPICKISRFFSKLRIAGWWQVPLDLGLKMHDTERGEILVVNSAWRHEVAANLADDTLIETAMIIGGLKTKEDTINPALGEFIERRRRHEIIKSFGAMEFDADYDYKKARQR